jgi:hypothetical protein
VVAKGTAISSESSDIVERKGGAELLERFKSDAFEKLQTIKQPDGIHELFRALFAVATKSAE